MVKEGTGLWDDWAHKFDEEDGVSATFDGVSGDAAPDEGDQHLLRAEEDGLSEVRCPETAADGRLQNAAMAADQRSRTAGNSGDKNLS